MSQKNQLVIDKVTIFAKGKPQMDIISGNESMFSSCSIYESIFKQYVTGNMTIVDSAGMLEGYPICGDEYIIISFKSSDFNSTKPYTKVFKIFKVDELTDLPANKTQIYNIHFASEIMDESQKRKLRLSFRNKREDEIIKSICHDTLGIPEKLLDIEKSLYERTFVIPNWSPLQAINHFTNSAIYPQNSRGANFVFYEDRDGFKFKSLETMMQDKIAGKLTTSTLTNSDNFHPLNVINFDIENCFDNIKNSQNGLYGSTVHEIDLLEKTVSTHEYTNELLLSQQVKIDKDAFPIRGNIGEDTNRKVIITHNNGNYTNGFNAIPKRLFALQQFENYKINAEVVPNTNFVIGQKVEFELRSIMKTVEEQNHAFLSGNFLITELWHNFTPSKHQMMLTLRKPTFKNQVNSKKRTI